MRVRFTVWAKGRKSIYNIGDIFGTFFVLSVADARKMKEKIEKNFDIKVDWFVWGDDNIRGKL